MQLKSMLSKIFRQKIKINDDASKASNTSKCRGFSLIDSMISFLIITIIVAAFAPVVIKKMTHGRGIVLKESSGTQKRCPHECILCKADGTCLLCPLRCDEGFYKDKQGCQCLDCSQLGDENCTGCTKDGDAIACTKCKTGYYLDEETHVCKECEAGYYCPNGITRVPCKKGTYQDATDPVEERYECNPCPPGTYQDEEGQTTCKLCNGGYCCAVEGMDHRDSCAPGSFSNNEGAKTECTDCYEGIGENTYSGTAAATCPLCTTKPNVATCEKEGGAIKTCVTGYHHSTSPDVCANCSAGYFMNASHKCQPCTPPNTTPDNNTLTKCSSCGEGCVECGPTFECTKCSAGFKLNASNKCEPCPAGTYSVEGSSVCTNCPPGTYCPNEKTSDPDNCPRAKYCPNERTITPDNCPAGKYCPNEGTIIPTNCSAGTYSAAGALNCSPCPAGTYCPNEGTITPTNCSAGTTSSAGATSCDPCEDGYYQNTSGQTTCKPCSDLVEHCENCNKTTGACEKCETEYAVNKTVAAPYVCTYRCKDEYGWKYAASINKCVGKYTFTPINAANVAYVNINESCTRYTSHYCCWKGNTATTCTNAGCSATVCDWMAAREICKYYRTRTDGTPYPTTTLLSMDDYVSLVNNNEAYGVSMCSQANNAEHKCTSSTKCTGSSYNQCVPESYQAETDSPGSHDNHVNTVGFTDQGTAKKHEYEYGIDGARQFRCKRDPDYGEEIK